MKAKYNKLSIRLIPALAVALLAAGCSKDGIEPEGPGGGTPGQGGDIRFEIGFAPQGGAAILQAAGPQTRVATDEDFNSTWQHGDEIGIFACAAGTPLTPSDIHIHNVRLTYTETTPGDPSTGSWSGEAWWPMDGTKLDFYAYYPYDVTATDPTAISFNVSADQRAAADHSSSDLLMAKSDNGGDGYGKADGTVNLSFSHALAMVQVTLDDTNRALEAGDGVSAVLIGFVTNGQLNLNTQQTPPNAQQTPPNPSIFQDITMYRVEQPTDEDYLTRYTFRALVPEQTVAQGTSIVRVINGDVILEGSKLTNDLVMKSGEVEKFTQKLPSFLPQMVQPEANSYMVRPGGRAILIPVSQANRVQGPDGLGAVTTGLGGVMKDNFTVQLVWADTPVGADGVVRAMDAVEYENAGYVRVKPGIAGNAVVAIKDKDNGNIKWSWHIWVTEPVEGGTDTETGLTWMDRNLGATSNTPYVDGSFDDDQWVKTLGLFYQWGRKDAFPGSDGTDNGNQTYYTPDEQSGTNANLPTSDHTVLPDMVQNPLHFTKNWSAYRGSTQQDDGDDSWGGETGEKTLYDPCPPGWKVPPISVDSKNVWGSNNASNWSGWNDYGRIFNGVNGTAVLGHYYPASGYRYTTNGQVYYPGTAGYYWSSCIYGGTNGYYLNFNGTGVTPQNSYNRTYGFSVRCVAAL